MNNLDFETRELQPVDSSVAATLMRNVYLWMTLALAITGATAWLAVSSPAIMQFVFGNNVVWITLLVVEVVMVIALTAMIDRLSFPVATLMFALYSVVNGLTLSTVFMAYELGSVASAFFIAAGMFAAMALVGSFVKKDLSGIGKFALMALIGLIIAMVVNLFVRNSVFDLIVSGVGVLIFAALTAYDSQKIKERLQMADTLDDSTMKIALMGSLTLYLDFINLLLDILRLFGKRK